MAGPARCEDQAGEENGKSRAHRATLHAISPRAAAGPALIANSTSASSATNNVSWSIILRLRVSRRLRVGFQQKRCGSGYTGLNAPVAEKRVRLNSGKCAWGCLFWVGDQFFSFRMSFMRVKLMSQTFFDSCEFLAYKSLHET